MPYCQVLLQIISNGYSGWYITEIHGWHIWNGILRHRNGSTWSKKPSFDLQIWYAPDGTSLVSWVQFCTWEQPWKKVVRREGERKLWSQMKLWGMILKSWQNSWSLIKDNTKQIVRILRTFYWYYRYLDIYTDIHQESL